MTTEQKIKLIKEYIRLRKEIEKKYEQERGILTVEFYEPFWHLDSFTCSIVENMIGDNFNWLSWFIENNYNGKASVKKGRMRKIDTVEKLVKLMEESE